MKPFPGVCFQLAGDGYHLKVVVTFPDAKGNVLVLGLTDSENFQNPICVFKRGDHPSVTKPTAVKSRPKLILPAEGFQSEMIKFHPRFSAEQICLIIEGAWKSEDIEPYILKMLPSAGKEMDEFLEKVKAEK